MKKYQYTLENTSSWFTRDFSQDFTLLSFILKLMLPLMSRVYLNFTIRRRQSASEKGSLRSSCIFVFNFFIASYDIDLSTSCRARVASRLSTIETAKNQARVTITKVLISIKKSLKKSIESADDRLTCLNSRFALPYNDRQQSKYSKIHKTT